MSKKSTDLQFNALTEFWTAAREYKSLKNKEKKYIETIEDMMDNLSIPLWYHDTKNIQDTPTPFQDDISAVISSLKPNFQTDIKILYKNDVFYCPEVTSFIMDVPPDYFPEISSPRLFESTLNCFFPLHESTRLESNQYDKTSLEYFDAYVFPYESKKRFTMFLDSSIRVSNELQVIISNYFKINEIYIHGNNTFIPPGFFDKKFSVTPKAYFLGKFKVFNNDVSKQTDEGLSIIDNVRGFKQRFLKIKIKSVSGISTIHMATNSKSYANLAQLLNL